MPRRSVSNVLGNSVVESDRRIILHYYLISELTDESPLKTSVSLPVSGQKFETETAKYGAESATCSTMTFTEDKEHIDEDV